MIYIVLIASSFLFLHEFLSYYENMSDKQKLQKNSIYIMEDINNIVHAKNLKNINIKDEEYKNSISLESSQLPYSNYVVKNNLSKKDLILLNKYNVAIKEILKTNPNAPDSSFSCSNLKSLHLLDEADCKTVKNLKYTTYSINDDNKISFEIKKTDSINDYIKTAYSNYYSTNKQNLKVSSNKDNYLYEFRVFNKTKRNLQDLDFKYDEIKGNFFTGIKNKNYLNSLEYIEKSLQLKNNSLSAKLIDRLINSIEEQKRKESSLTNKIITTSLEEEIKTSIIDMVLRNQNKDLINTYKNNTVIKNYFDNEYKRTKNKTFKDYWK